MLAQCEFPSLNQRVLHKQSMQTLRGKNEKLEKLCRALQTERNDLNRKLKDKVMTVIY